MENELFDRIRHDLAGNDVVLYLKGTRNFPQDGYSAIVVRILDELNADYITIDVLEDENLHRALKEFSGHIGVPQLYVRGTFIGGADAIKEMQASGKLKTLLAQEI